MERLLNLTALLLETPRPLSAQEIRERLGAYPDELESFRRAFERDKDDLRAMGVPLEVAEVPGVVPAVEGYRIPKDRYYLRDPGLTPDELAALRMAASVVRLDGLSAREGLLKLGGLVGDADDPGLEVGSLPAGNVGRCSAPSRPGCRCGSPTRTRCARSTPTASTGRGRWYLSGSTTPGRGSSTGSTASRAASRRWTARFARPPSTSAPGARLEAWQLGGGEPVEAKVLVGAPQAPWIVHHLGAGPSRRSAATARWSSPWR